MDSYTLMQKYPNVSREELDKIRAISHYPSFSEVDFERSLSSLDREKEEERLNGTRDFLVGPLIQVVSVQFLSTDDIDQNQSFTIYGRIYAEFRDTASGKTIAHDFYNRERGDAQVLESNESLTLIIPDFSYWPFNLVMPLEHTKLFVDVYVMDKNLSAEIRCGDHETNLEKVIEERIYCDFGSLVLRYSITPFVIRGHVEVRFFRKEGCTQGPLNVNGIIVARSSNTFGGYTLFHKKSNEFERVETDVARNTMNLARCWVNVSAHSFLIIDMDLSEKGTECKILKETVELQVQDMTFYDAFIVGDLIINVSVAWFSPMPLGRCIQEESDDDESSADEMSSLEASEEEGDDEQMGEACILNVPSHLSHPWQLRAHHNAAPLSSCALQIFSIFIGREKLKALQIYGSIQVSAPPCTYYIFKKEASGAYGLHEGSKTLPVRHGSGVYDDCETLKIDFDLKDLESRLRIRGHVSWHWSSFRVSPRKIDKQLCSVVQGEHGFAAIHYSLFSEAVQASVVALCKSKDGAVHFSTKVFGSLIARYDNYDYTSRYNRDYYRVFLFERDEEDPAEVGSDGAISLSRPVVAVRLCL